MLHKTNGEAPIISPPKTQNVQNDHGPGITTICLSYSNYESKTTTKCENEKLPSSDNNSEQRSLSGSQNFEEFEEKTFKIRDSNYLSINAPASSTSSLPKIKNTHAIIIFNQNLFSLYLLLSF